MNNELRFPTDIKFYDTCSLLLARESLFAEDQPKFLVSSITFKELERIKTANNKTDDVKYAARLLLHLFDQNPNHYDVVIHRIEYEDYLRHLSLDITDDTRILSDAIHADRTQDIVFVTNDLSLKHIANLYFGDGMIESIEEDQDYYTGYKEVICNDELLAKFYQNSTVNYFNSLVGEYVIIKNSEGEVIDIRVWSGTEYRFLNTKPFNSDWFGKVVPYHDDIYQKLLFDSLHNNKITMVKGPAGSGKTQVSLAYLFSELEKHRLDKIIVFCNTVATANSAKLGFYPGTRHEKLLDSQIGNLLSSKLGGKMGVEQLINDEKLVLLPLSDIRGFDTNGMNAGIYISEAQNLDRTLMKLALQRIGEDCVCIIDGDDKSQVDLPVYQGANNGMKRVSKVFRGHEGYGEIQLNNIYRSQIARIAEAI